VLGFAQSCMPSVPSVAGKRRLKFLKLSERHQGIPCLRRQSLLVQLMTCLSQSTQALSWEVIKDSWLHAYKACQRHESLQTYSADEAYDLGFSKNLS